MKVNRVIIHIQISTAVYYDKKGEGWLNELGRWHSYQYITNTAWVRVRIW